MKKNLINAMNRIYLFLLAMCTSVAVTAQEAMDVNVDVNGGGSAGWYSNPWVWIVGAAVFILLLVAIVRGGGRTSD